VVEVITRPAMWTAKWYCSSVTLLNVTLALIAFAMCFFTYPPLPEEMKNQACCSENRWGTGNGNPPNINGTVCCSYVDSNRYGGVTCHPYDALTDVYPGLLFIRWALFISISVFAFVPYHLKNEYIKITTAWIAVVVYGALFIASNIVLWQGMNLSCKDKLNPTSLDRTTATDTIIQYAVYDFVILVLMLAPVYGAIACAALVFCLAVIVKYCKLWCMVSSVEEDTERSTMI